MRIALVCGSRKPAAGQNHKRSACRELLRVVEQGVRSAGGEPEVLDLRDLTLPFFDGRDAEQYGVADLSVLHSHVGAADALILAAPAYWGGLAGALKNALDLLGGAAYDTADRLTPFAGKTVGLLVVGAAPGDAEAGCRQLRVALGRMGARCLEEAVVVDNPRTCPTMDAVIHRAFALGHLVALWAAQAVKPERTP
jgi:NAD(P)H-dependent FMN reductase